MLTLRLAVTLVLADLSYRFVERPIRRGALGRAWKALRKARGGRLWWIGAAGELEQTIDSLSIEADVGLQAPAAIDILRKRRDAGRLGEVVVVHIGSNGAFSEEQFEEMMEVLADVHRVAFVK